MVEQDILIFEIHGRKFGVPAALVVEVVRAVTPLPVPRAPAVVMGIINLRGTVVPVLDTRAVLKLPKREVLHTDHLIIVRVGELNYAIHVDRAVDLSRMQTATEGEECETVESADEKVIANVGLIDPNAPELVQIVHPADLLGEEDCATLADIVSSTPANEIQA